MLRDWLKKAMREVYSEPQNPTPANTLDQTLRHDAACQMQVFRIDNGYIARLTNAGGTGSMVYCVDIDSVARAMLVYEAKIKMGFSGGQSLKLTSSPNSGY